MNNPISGSTIHHFSEVNINIQPVNKPAIIATPPMRGTGVSCKERSLGMSCISLPNLLIRMMMVSNMVTKAATTGE